MSLFNSDISAKYRKNSYSQSGEDIIVKSIFDIIGIKKPSYIDIGAHHPFNINNTAIFYKNGSRGINIEPNPILFKEFLKYRKNDTNLNIGISDRTDIMDFYLMNAASLSTFSKLSVEEFKKNGNYSVQKTEKIPVDTIANILKKYSNDKFPEFLTIDAEGTDEIILKSIDYQLNYPIVICVESITFSNFGLGEKNHELINFLENRNYLMYADTYLNSIFVRKENWIRKTLK